MKDSLAWVAEIMARQDGVIARRQVLNGGVTAGQIRQRLESGRWLVTHPSVYRSVEHQFTPAARTRAAGLWGGKNAFLYGTAAACGSFAASCTGTTGRGFARLRSPRWRCQ